MTDRLDEAIEVAMAEYREQLRAASQRFRARILELVGPTDVDEPGEAPVTEQPSGASVSHGRAGASGGADVDCPDCGKRVKQLGLGTHRRRAHGRRAEARPPKGRRAVELLPKRDRQALIPAPTTVRARESATDVEPAPAVEPVIRKGEEWFLCPRCTEKFRTRERLTDHLKAGHPPDGGGLKPVGRGPGYRTDGVREARQLA